MALPGPKVQLHGGNLFETIISALVIVVAVAFAIFVYVRTGTGHMGSHSMRVRLHDAAALSVGSEVRLAGAKVGSVTGLALDLKDYNAIVEIRIRDDLSLPVDSRAVVSFSPLGDIFLSLTPGHAARSVPPDGELKMASPRGQAGV
jgi:phospholipid/cholesterol/gamma-HCH transport system substrate-binding protein